MQITRGHVLVQRIFDVADEIRLAEAEACLRGTAQTLGFVRTASRVRTTEPPLEVRLGERATSLSTLPTPEVVVRLYDVGAMVVTFEMRLPTPLGADALIELSANLGLQAAAVTEAARPIVAEVMRAISSACTVANTGDVVEDYTLFLIEAWEGQSTVDELIVALDAARLLLGERGPIADQERQHVTRQSFSYEPGDVVIIDWNSALIVDPRGDRDVADVLELASMQLLELRAYDQLVGRALQRFYVELSGRGGNGFAVRRYHRLSRDIMRMFVDLAELTGRFDNSLHLAGDAWLARIHRAALAEFDIPRWQRQLADKVEVLHQINTLLVDQITARNTLRVEVAIVLLIVLELVLALLKVA